MAQAADRFVTLSSNAGSLVGRIGANGQCSAIAARNSAAPRATASIFKIWMLGGVARAIVAGTASTAECVAMVASEIAPGELINVEPIGTLFLRADLAVLMMGNSDNTATDLLHERLGRSAIGAVVDAYGVAQPDLLKPMVGISEQFHVFLSFPLVDALSYVDGTQAFKDQFLAEHVVPLGPNTGGSCFHPALLTDGT
ncbi:MAG: serine hydrolase [Dokdonella sp.]